MTMECGHVPSAEAVPTCDMDVCGTCYGEALEREPYRPAKALTPMPACEDCGEEFIAFNPHHVCPGSRAEGHPLDSHETVVSGHPAVRGSGSGDA